MKPDWSVLRGAAGVFAICALVSVTLFGLSAHFRDSMRSEYRAFHGQFLDVSRKYQAIDEDEQIIEDYLPEFRRLHRRGIIGAERRLDWIESVQAAGADLPGLSYRINAQRVVGDAYGVPSGAFDIYGSEMELNLELLHEGDLGAFARRLVSGESGLGTFRSCRFARANQRPDEQGAATPRLLANCRVDWLTVDLRGEARLDL